MENKKRCPKCGEENPSDAVMCWACYTPLNNTVNIGGGAKSAGNKSSRGAQALDDDDDDGPKLGAQPWQIAVIALGLIFALFTVGRNFLPSGSNSDLPPAVDAVDPMPTDGMGDAPAPTTTTTDGGTSSSSSVPVPEKLPFTVAVAPNPNVTVGTMAIVPTNPNISTSQAASLATFTRNQFTQVKRWKTLYIYVFRDRKSAQEFATYQRRRRGAPLTPSDYNNLTHLWSSALACYEYNQGSERIYTPSNNPNGWWSR